MAKNKKRDLGYLIPVLSLLLALPVGSILIEAGLKQGSAGLWDLMGKWFVFWAIGCRLFLAGLRQIFQPGFTAREIFKLKDKGSYAIVKELGFANLCMGLAGILTLPIPAWLVPTAFIGGLYYGLAGVGHLTKKSDSLNESAAMVTDIFLFLVVLAYLLHGLM